MEVQNNLFILLYINILIFDLQERVKVLSELVREIQKSRDENVPQLNAINSLSEKIISEEKLTFSNRVSNVF